MDNLSKKVARTLKNEGPLALAKKSKNFIGFHLKNGFGDGQDFKDILFINGCTLPHPQRYRVDHQIEQLEAYGIRCDKIFYEDLTLDILKFYRGFVFYRCPVTPIVEEFIKLAKENNKTVFYDIDDLVYDTKYTNQIPYVRDMPKEEKKTYDDGVVRMGKTLALCDYGITTTERLKTEMEKTALDEVFVNRNVASERMVELSQLALEKSRDENKVIMGYFSGSITHNSDFELIMPTIIDLLKKHDNLYLKIVGILDLPSEMEVVKDKVLVAPFCDWEKLPELVHSVDINLAPIENTIFNEAKSENKWTEAALVKVPTVASNVGAFKAAIQNGKTGLLCTTEKEWLNSLEKLIEDKQLREEIAENAYSEAMRKYITTYSGKGLADFISEKLQKSIMFILPTTNVSGGVMVILKHAFMLKDAGYDVIIGNADADEADIVQREGTLLVVSIVKHEITAHIDTAVATLWTTLGAITTLANCDHRKYLVQNFETDFYEYGKAKEKGDANATYNQVPGVEYVTISKWCKNWLEKDFGNRNVKFASNGIDSKIFPYKTRKFSPSKKIKILIEGDSKSHYKNVDESFRIVEKLDKEKYEIHYLSYNGKPKSWYHVDCFHQNIPHDEVGKIYQSCDILLKTSILESFSYPPLEMMATGGFVVVRPNEGNIEYLKNEKNCLFYEPGNISDAVAKIEELSSDPKLREKLERFSAETVKARSWSNLEKEVLRLYN